MYGVLGGGIYAEMAEYPNDLLGQYRSASNKLKKIERIVFK